jgi:hypothetical protein
MSSNQEKTQPADNDKTEEKKDTSGDNDESKEQKGDNKDDESSEDTDSKTAPSAGGHNITGPEKFVAVGGSGGQTVQSAHGFEAMVHH